MNTSFATEVAFAFCLQVALIVLVTKGLQKWLGDARSVCRLWTTCFLMILGMLAAATLLPHRRWFGFPEFISREAVLNIVFWQSWMAGTLLIVWLIGVSWLLLRRGLRCLQLLRFLSTRCQPLTPQDRASLPLNISNPNLKILVCDLIQGPFCFQLQRPVIVLPRYVLQQDATTLRHVLRHEMEHLRTNHPMQHFLQNVCSTLLWFHPAVWMAAGSAELTREYLCDEVAAAEGGQYSAYLRTLVTIAQRCSSDSCIRVPVSALAFGNRQSALVKRSERLVKRAAQPTTNKFQSSRSVVAVVVLVSTACLLSQVWLPTNAMASRRSDWSPWPRWTASVLHSLDIKARDFEPFDERTAMHELLEDDPS